MKFTYILAIFTVFIAFQSHASYRDNDRHLNPLQRLLKDYIVEPAVQTIKDGCASAIQTAMQDPEKVVNTASMALSGALALNGVVHLLTRYPLDGEDTSEMAQEALTRS